MTMAGTDDTQDASLLDDDDYQQLLRKRLMDKMNQYDRGLQFDSANAGQATGTEGALSRNLILNQALSKAAAQVGTIGGKTANTDVSDVANKELLANQQQGLELGSKDAEARDKLQQYLMGKMLDQEGSLAKNKEATGRTEAEIALRKEDNKQKSLDRAAGLQAKREELAANRAMKEKEFEAKADNKKAGAQVPGSVAAELGQFDSAVAMVDDLKKSYDAKASQTGSGLKSYLPGSEANQYEKERDVAAQEIGRILEGGKLTDRDYDRYKAMLPTPSDRNDVAEAKTAALKNLIAQSRKGKIGGLAQTGFDVSGVTPKEPPGFKPAVVSNSGVAQAGTGPSAADAKALAWAKANPQDPRSAAIFEKLKSKGVQ